MTGHWLLCCGRFRSSTARELQSSDSEIKSRCEAANVPPSAAVGVAGLVPGDFPANSCLAKEQSIPGSHTSFRPVNYRTHSGGTPSEEPFGATAHWEDAGHYVGGCPLQPPPRGFTFKEEDCWADATPSTQYATGWLPGGRCRSPLCQGAIRTGGQPCDLPVGPEPLATLSMSANGVASCSVAMQALKEVLADLRVSSKGEPRLLELRAPLPSQHPRLPSSLSRTTSSLGAAAGLPGATRSSTAVSANTTLGTGANQEETAARAKAADVGTVLLERNPRRSVGDGGSIASRILQPARCLLPASLRARGTTLPAATEETRRSCSLNGMAGSTAGSVTVADGEAVCSGSGPLLQRPQSPPGNGRELHHTPADARPPMDRAPAPKPKKHSLPWLSLLGGAASTHHSPTLVDRQDPGQFAPQILPRAPLHDSDLAPSIACAATAGSGMRAGSTPPSARQACQPATAVQVLPPAGNPVSKPAFRVTRTGLSATSSRLQSGTCASGSGHAQDPTGGPLAATEVPRASRAVHKLASPSGACGASSFVSEPSNSSTAAPAAPTVVAVSSSSSHPVKHGSPRIDTYNHHTAFATSSSGGDDDGDGDGDSGCLTPHVWREVASIEFEDLGVHMGLVGRGPLESEPTPRITSAPHYASVKASGARGPGTTAAAAGSLFACQSGLLVVEPGEMELSRKCIAKGEARSARELEKADDSVTVPVRNTPGLPSGGIRRSASEPVTLSMPLASVASGGPEGTYPKLGGGRANTASHGGRAVSIIDSAPAEIDPLDHDGCGGTRFGAAAMATRAATAVGLAASASRIPPFRRASPVYRPVSRNRQNGMKQSQALGLLKRALSLQLTSGSRMTHGVPCKVPPRDRVPHRYLVPYNDHNRSSSSTNQSFSAFPYLGVHVQGSPKSSISYVPPCQRGHVVATTRLPTWSSRPSGTAWHERELVVSLTRVSDRTNTAGGSFSWSGLGCHAGGTGNASGGTNQATTAISPTNTNSISPFGANSRIDTSQADPGRISASYGAPFAAGGQRHPMYTSKYVSQMMLLPFLSQSGSLILQGGQSSTPAVLNLSALSKEITWLKWIGQGGGGAVFQCLWQGVHVAVKFRVSEEDSGASASTNNAVLEGLVSCAVHHPNVLHTFAFECARLTEAVFEDTDSVSFGLEEGGTELLDRLFVSMTHGTADGLSLSRRRAPSQSSNPLLALRSGSGTSSMPQRPSRLGFTGFAEIASFALPVPPPQRHPSNIGSGSHGNIPYGKARGAYVVVNDFAGASGACPDGHGHSTVTDGSSGTQRVLSSGRGAEGGGAGRFSSGGHFWSAGGSTSRSGTGWQGASGSEDPAGCGPRTVLGWKGSSALSPVVSRSGAPPPTGAAERGRGRAAAATPATSSSTTDVRSRAAKPLGKEVVNDVRHRDTSRTAAEVLAANTGGAAGGAAGGARVAVSGLAGPASFHSEDGFGDPEADGSMCWSLRQVLTYLKARPGMYMTHIIMEYCDRGSLLSAIKSGVFRSNNSSFDPPDTSAGFSARNGGAVRNPCPNTAGGGAGAASGLQSTGLGPKASYTVCPRAAQQQPLQGMETSALALARGMAQQHAWAAQQQQQQQQDAVSARLALRGLLRTAREVAQGMSHLHANGIIHGDLKPGNVLLRGCRTDRRGFTAVVSDFGLSKIIRNDKPLELNDWSTVTVMAPEVIMGRWLKASDVFSFGILLWQLVTSEVMPYGKCTVPQILMGVSEGTLKPEWPASAHPALVRLGRACLAHYPEKRPNFEAIVKMLTKIEKDVRQELQVQSAAKRSESPASLRRCT